MHYKKKLTKEKKYKNLKKINIQEMKNKTPKAKVHQTLDLPGKNTKKWEYDIITNQTVY